MWITVRKISLFLSIVGKPSFREAIVLLYSSSFFPLAQDKNIVQTAIDNGNFTTLVAALTAADLVNTLKGAGPFTVFAPTDAAFSKLLPETIEDLLKPENKEKLSNILKYHVIGGRVTSGDINMMPLPVQVETFSGLRSVVDKNGNNVKVNDATVTLPDVSSTNGIIHIIDTVLLPLTDIVETAGSAGFSTLVTAVTAADLVTALKGAGPFTVFAPTDAAFGKLPVGVFADLIKTENKPTLTRILQYHVVGSLVTTNSINRMTLPANVTMSAGGSGTVSKNGNIVMVNNAAVVTADVFNSNGMIHAIDSVLLPPLDIVDTAILNGNFKTLVAALQAADLVGALTGPGPFTVFAPTDAAFSKLPAGTVDDLLKPENKEKLSIILKYHVIGKRVTSDDINKMTLPAQVETLSGLRSIVDKNGNAFKVNDATVTVPDVSNTNGIIHIIDTVLLPPTDIAYTTLNTILKTLVELIAAANLTETLKGAGPFTLFAPTDDAFRKLPEGVLADLWQPENKPKLTGILQYHVVGSLVTTGAINRMTLPAKVEMIGGGTVTVKKEGNSTKINDATVTTSDVYNTNGIIHIIDTVLIPSAPAPSSTTPASSFATPATGSATPAPASITPASTTPAPGSATLAPGSATPAPGSTTPASSSTAPFSVNQGFFIVFVSAILFSRLFSI
jgi:transforming growth factor-beta-induced protein